MYGTAKCINRALQDENSACLEYDLVGDYAILANFSLSAAPSRGLFVKSEDSIFTVLVSWGFPKGSPLIQDFSQIMLHILASGLYRYWVDTELDTKWRRVTTRSRRTLLLESAFWNS